MTANPMTRNGLLTCIIIALMLTHSNAYCWVPPYEEDQLDLMNDSLGKVAKQRLIEKHASVIDLFKGKGYEPPRDFLPDASAFDRVPEHFDNIEQATNAGVQCDHIKSSKQQTCMMIVREGQGAGLIIYDQDLGGKYKKTQVICLPTWYQEAKVDLIDILNNQIKFIRIEHQTGGGTGASGIMHWIIGWHDGGFRTVFWESVYTQSEGSGSHYYLQLQYKIHNGKKAWISMNFRNDRIEIHGEPYDYHADWKDWLFWDDKAFSFYNAAQEDSKINLSKGFFCERVQISARRKRILLLPPVPYGLTCTEDLGFEYLENISGRESCEKQDGKSSRSK